METVLSVIGWTLGVVVVGLMAFGVHHGLSEKRAVLRRAEEKEREMRRRIARLEAEGPKTDPQSLQVLLLKTLQDDCSVETISIENGAGRTRGAVIINVTWKGSPRAHVRLNLYKHQGQVFTDLKQLTTIPNVQHLHYVSDGIPLHYEDPNVIPNQTYNYYFALSTDLSNSETTLFLWCHRPHVARLGDSSVKLTKKEQFILRIHEMREAKATEAALAECLKTYAIEHSLHPDEIEILEGEMIAILNQK